MQYESNRRWGRHLGTGVLGLNSATHNLARIRYKELLAQTRKLAKLIGSE